MSLCEPPDSGQGRFGPDDPLAPSAPQFAEGWHAQVLAMADTMVTSGQIAASDWAEALGAELRAGDQAAEPDTQERYYAAALRALEALMDQGRIVSASDLTQRRDAWAKAYHETPHGQPVALKS